MAASYWSPDKEMAALLRQLDEDELGSFAEAMSEQNSQEVLYSACHEIYLRTKSDRDLTILIDTAETFLSAMLAKSGKTETYAVVATETSKLRREKFERNLQVVDLERAIELIGEAISVTSDSSKSTMRLEYLSSLLDIKDNLPQGKDPEERRLKRDDGDKIQKMQWYAKIGDEIPESQPILFPFSKVAKVKVEVPAHEACATVVHIYCWEKGPPPVYKDDSVWEIAKLEIDLMGMDIPTRWINGRKFYEARFDVEMTLYSASVSFCAVYTHGQEVKRFKAKNVLFL